MFVDAIINFPSVTNDHNIVSRLPTLIITNSTESYNNIHRFFDSSPFSPSSRYIAYSRLPSFMSFKNNKDNKNYAEVIVSDLKIGKHIVIDATLAWVINSIFITTLSIYDITINIICDRTRK